MSVRKVVSIEKAEWCIAPAPAWAFVREPNWDFVPPEDHALTFLLLDEQHHVATQTCTRRTIRKLITFAAVQALGQVEFDFDPAEYRLLIHELAIWRQSAAGSWEKRSLAERDTLLLRQREQQFEQQMLNGRVSVVALLEDVRVGDAIDLCWTLEPIERLPGMHFTVFYAFAWSVPVARVFFTLHQDPEVPLRWRLHAPADAPRPAEEVTAEHLTWTMERPAVFKPEPNVPGSHWAFAMLDISGWSSWREVADFIAALWVDALGEGAEIIAAEADRLRAAHQQPSEAVRAAIRFVQEDIRYLAVDFGPGGGLLPNGAATVLRRRFGDCKDKAVLLAALLRAMGLEVWPLLVGANWKEAVARVLPSPIAFSHAIITFLTNGKRVFVDPTLLGQGGELADLIAPPYGCGLEVRTGAMDLLTLPPQPPASISLTETFNLDRKGSDGYVEQRLCASAGLADDIRGTLVRQGSSAFLQARIETLQRQFPALQSGEQAVGLTDSINDNTIEWRATHTLSTWGPAGQKPPAMFRYGAHGLHLALDIIEGPEQRHQPWALRHPLSIHHRVVVRGRCVGKTKPEKLRMSGPGFRYACDVTVDRHEITFDYRWETTQHEVPPAQWVEYCKERANAFEHAGANVATGGLSERQTGKVIVACTLALGIALAVISERLPPTSRQGGGALDPVTLSTLEKDTGAAFEAVRRGDHAKAEPLVRKVARYYQHSFDFQMLQADVMIQTGHLDEVPPLIAAARKIQPASTVPDLLEAILLEKRGELPLARERFQKVLMQTPGDLHALHGIGRVSELLGDRVTARQVWEKFLAVQPANPEVLGRYALLLWSNGERHRADEVILGMVRAQPVAGAALEATLSGYYDQTGRSAEAVAPAKRAAELAPNDPLVTFRYAMALLRVGEANAALDYARQKTAGQNHPLVWRSFAVAAATAGNNEDAERGFRAWLQTAPRDPEAHANYGFFLHQTGRSVEARTALQKALRDFPGHGPLWLNYSVVLGALGDPEAAEARNKAAALMPMSQRATLVR